MALWFHGLETMKTNPIQSYSNGVQTQLIISSRGRVIEMNKRCPEALGFAGVV
jgi:hypothetical protein